MSPLEAVRQAEARLAESRVPSPRVDAELLVAHVLGLSRTGIYANGRIVSPSEADQLGVLVARRAEREPLAYVLGDWGFRRLSLRVDDRVLVPRPETEVVVERCLERLRGLEAPAVLDVGTGSGAIALAIADEHPGARVVAVDSSPDALAVARENVQRSGLDQRVELGESDLLAGVSGPFDLVVSNPPYVSPSDWSGSSRRFETTSPSRPSWAWRLPTGSPPRRFECSAAAAGSFSSAARTRRPASQEPSPSWAMTTSPSARTSPESTA